jgi:hypothetical protein
MYVNLKVGSSVSVLQYYTLLAEKSFHTYTNPKTFKEMHIKVP